MRILRDCCLIIVLGMFFAKEMKAQYFSFMPEEFGGGIFFGMGSGISKDDLTIALGYEVTSKIGVFQFRVGGIHDGISVTASTPRDVNVDVSLLYGWRIFLDHSNSNSNLALTVLAGIGETSFVRKGSLISEGSIFGGREYEKVVNSVLGYPYEFSLSSINGMFGVKIAFIGNLNSEESYSGFAGGFILKVF